jgi:hypothetical protein
MGLAAIAVLVGAFVTIWGLALPVFREISLLGIPFLVIGALLLRMVHKAGRESGATADTTDA